LRAGAWLGGWFGPVRRAKGTRQAVAFRHRRGFFEPLEDRRLLAGNILIATGGATSLPAAALTFSDNSDVTIDPSAFTSAGTDINLEANNNITFQNAVSLPGGIALVAQANTAILVNASLATTSANLTLDAGLLDNSGKLSASGATGGQLSITAGRLVNSGQITADGSAGAGGDISISLAQRMIQTQSGLVSASGAGGSGGQVTIIAPVSTAADSDSTDAPGAYLSGSVSADGRGPGDVGGQITVTGYQLDLYGATLEADGASGGGQIRVGGDFHGQGDLPTAKLVTVNQASVLSADALAGGDGGQVVVWSDQQTSFAGLVTACGGPQKGDGGKVEVSSRTALDWQGKANVSAVAGQPGSLLLDPQNITVAGPAFSEFVDPDPAAGNEFGASVVPLSTGNVVVTSPDDGFGGKDAGAVYLFNGATGALVSTLRGSDANDNVGVSGATALTNGNYVICSPNWGNDVGAVTWGSGTSGVSGIVSSANSLVGSNLDDRVGLGGVTALADGNYVVDSYGVSRGAVTWGSGTSGVSGTISSANSLVGSAVSDEVGVGGVTALANGNYVVDSDQWNIDRGAVTWGSGTSGVSGAVSSANSLVGSTGGDEVGYGGVTALANGNFVVDSYPWNRDRGAVTWGSGTSGISGPVSSSNSLIGSAGTDTVGRGGVSALANGNYVVSSPSWSSGAGAVTWGSGASGVSGTISSANSLVGPSSGNQVGYGGVIALVNGNYVVDSPDWFNGGSGAVTWGNGTSGTSGVVSATNSLVGTATSSPVGQAGVTALANGNYVVDSYQWNSKTGAVTWGNGTSGAIGSISTANSLVGSAAGDYVGKGGVTALANGNYVVESYDWINGAATAAGAVTWGSGTSGVSGVVSSANSLVGSIAYDYAGYGNNGADGVIALANGNYVVRSCDWINGAATYAGAVTWCSGTAGTSGTISTVNSLVGSAANDEVGYGGVTALANGNYVVSSPDWINGTASDAGAVTWGNGTTGTSGAVSSANSLVGLTGNAGLQPIVVDNVNGTFYARFDTEAGTTPSGGTYGGRVRVGSQNAPLASQTFSSQTGQSVTFTPAVTGTLDTGSAVTLQASNDITVASAINASNPGGSAGNLTLQAGRSLLLDANITTGNGNLTVTANDTAADGVVNSDRQSGSAVITMAGGTTLNVGSGTLTVSLDNSTDKTYNASGVATLQNVSAASTVLDAGTVLADGTITGPVAVNSGAVLGGSGDVTGTVSAASGGTVAPGTSGPGLLSAGSFSLNTGASLNVDLDGVTAGTQCGQVVVSGTVNLDADAVAGATLNLSLGYAPTLGDQFVVINSTATPAANHPIAGTFANLPQGGTISATYGGTIYWFRANYDGGDGNDLVLTTIAVPTTTTLSTSQPSATYGAPPTFTAVVTASAGTPTGSVEFMDESTGADLGSVSTTSGTTSTTATWTFTPATTQLQYTLGDAIEAIYSPGNGFGASPNNPTVTQLINQATLTPSITAEDKTYDGTTTVTLTSQTVATIFGSDQVSLVVGAASFTSPSAGLETVTATGLSLSGSGAANYTLSSSTASTTATITPATLTPSITAAGKTYDGTTKVTLTSETVATAIGSDQVSLEVGAASFACKNVGLETVTATGLSLSGSGAANYTLSGTTASTTATISAPSVPLKVIDDSSTAFQVTSGTWNPVTASSAYLGSDHEAASTVASATWTFSGLTPGATYTVYATWPAGSNRATSVPYTVTADGNTSPTLLVNQTIAPSKQIANSGPTGATPWSWTELGSSVYTVGSDGKLVMGVSNTGTTGKVEADAVMIQLVTPELAAGGPGNNPRAAPLTASQAMPLVREAELRWAAAGANVSGLTNVQVIVGNLPGTVLGESAAGVDTIFLDKNAKGWGWFIDPTPRQDTEFPVQVAGTEERATSGPAAGQMDLLTVIMHEMGHFLGYSDLSPQAFPYDLMSADLAAGIRRLPAAAAAQGTSAPTPAGGEDSAVAEQAQAKDAVFAALAQPQGGTTAGKTAESESNAWWLLYGEE
jgi:hypothetical protein